eukprot:Sspe_Gene.31077::Locus_15342_Transcript_1_1_Confidence_1.000_Length_2719::g.31077::m.31077/K08776/NPEPPS; puromycin-sensitive aminopeptidase
MPFVLPTAVAPRTYRLQLEPDLEKFVFQGSVEIDVDVLEPTKTVSLNARNLGVLSAKVSQDGEAEDAVTINYHVKDNVLEIGAKKELKKGEAKIQITFVGTLNDRMQGFYRSKYKRGGETKYMAVTQFEPIDARECFPCWDEPAVKAVFEVTMLVPPELSVFANMPEKECVMDAGKGKKRVSFLPTPKMSTYLLAFAVGEFDFIQGCTNNGTLIRCISVPGKSSQLQYALTTGIKSLEFYNEFFGIPYPLPKLDMLAVPDFAAGAMENWGLVTYREADMLVDSSTPMRTMQRVCTVVTHELAHQWFGNLVTMKWWDNLWLNEGFANWMQVFCADHIHPEWNMWEQYVGMEQNMAFKLDGLRSSHPVQVDIPRAEAVDEVFDHISYCKGGSVVRMVYSVVGKEKFREGLQLYMSKYKYTNTDTDDLWGAWEKTSGLPIKEMMDSWVLQMGYPVVSAEVVSTAGDKTTLRLTQKWFLSDGEKADDRKWVVPIFITTAKGQHPLQLMKDREITVEVPASASDWILINSKQNVLMRVKYSEELMKRLVGSIATFSPEDRIGLVRDVYALAQCGEVDPLMVATMYRGFKEESNDKVWAELATVAHGLDRLMCAIPNAPRSEMFKFFAEVARPMAEKLGWDAAEGDDANRRKLRSIVIPFYLHFNSNDEGLRKEAQKRFKDFIEDPSKLPSDIRLSVLTHAMITSPSENWEHLKRIHNASDDSILRREIYGAIGSTTDKGVLKAFANWLLSDDVRPQDMVFGLSSMSLNISDGTTSSTDICFEFIRTNIKALFGRINTSFRRAIVSSSGGGYCTAKEADAVEEFWKGPEGENLEMSVKQTCEGIRVRDAFVKRVAASKLAHKDAWSL